jgi:hypothetical protein
MGNWHHKTQSGGVLAFRGTSCTIGDDGLLSPQPQSTDLLQLRWLHAYPHVELRENVIKPEDKPAPIPAPPTQAQPKAVAKARKPRAKKPTLKR